MAGIVRELIGDDAAAVAALARVSKATAMPWLPVLHTLDEDRAFYGDELSTSRGWGVDLRGRLSGFALVRDGWLNHLYVAPDAQGRGIGSALLGRVLDDRSSIDLWAFEDNRRARGFYAQHGFDDVERTDGSGNEERMPDVRLRWSPGGPDVLVRTAQPGDADQIARVHTSTWQHAYAGLLPQEYLDALDWGTRREWWATHLSEPAVGGAVDLVAVVSGSIVGFASLGPPRDDDLAPDQQSWRELYALYVSPEASRKGVGTALWRRARGVALGADVASMALWVLGDNVPAQRFYAAAGCAADGAQRNREIGGRRVAEVRFACRL